MKKRFTRILAAVALLVGLTIPMGMWGQTTVTFTAGTDTGTSSVTKNGITVSMTTMNETVYKCYKSSSMTVSSTVGNITQVSLTCTAENQDKYGPGCFSLLNTQPGNYTYSSYTGTWTGSATEFSLYASLNQVRMSQIVVVVGGSAPTTYTVTYNCNGADSGCPNPATFTVAQGATITLEDGPVKDGYDFAGWSDGTTTYDEGDEYEVNSNVTFTAQWTEVVSADEQWVLTSLADLTSTDVFVIVGNNGSNYAMSNNNGTSNPPAAVAVTVTGNKITSTVSANIKWTISDNADGYTFYPNGSTTTWLYCTNTNNGVRVGTNANKTFIIADGYLKHVGTSRYVGIYDSQDWRCYTSINSNITGQTFAFYKKVTGGVVPPSISANAVNIAYNATSGSITYTINNGVEGGAVTSAEVTASNPENWLTVIGSNPYASPISLSCAPNTTATEKTATVTLTYTYNRETITETVNVTQAADPNATMTIAEVRAQGTGNVITKGIVTHMNGVTAYIQDETAAIVVYGSDVPTVGDEIRVSGTLTSYKGLLEIGSSSNPPTITVLSQGNTVDPTVMTIEAINEDFEGNNAYQAKLVRIENAIYNDGVVSQDNNSITVYGTMSGVSNGTIVSFTGNIGCYNDVQIVNPTDIIASYPLTINGYTDVTEGNNNKGYYLIASPVTVNLTNHDMTNGDFDLYYFDESQELEWRNYEDTPFNLVPGKGYLYAKKGEGQTYNFTLTGAPYNNQPITLSKSESGDFAGWNLIGNPYATAATVSAESFYRMNPEGRADLIEGSGSVDAMEGIFVIAENDGEEVTFTPSTSSKSFEQVAINLLKNRGNVIDRAVVRFGEGRQLPKFQLNPRNTKIYVTEGNKDYAVVRSAAEAEMPVSFRASENGTYTLAVEAENVEMNYLHLIDNLTGMDVDLLQTPSYTFEAKTSDYASRFRLVFKANGTNENNAETFAYFNGTNWTVSNVGDATLQVVDVTGRTVANQMINGNAELNLNQPAGVYVIRLVNGDNVKTQKVVVR